MKAGERYEQWMENPYFDEDTKAELKSIESDEKEIEEIFTVTWNLLQEGCGESSAQEPTE